MTFAGSRDIDPVQGSPLSTTIIRWLPNAIRLAALVALVTLAATIEWPDTRAPDHPADQMSGQSDTVSEPVFDGRGKWGGYAR